MEMKKKENVLNSNENAILFTNATKVYNGKKIVLKNLNMSVKQGVIYGLLGPSGCGKTTLLKCIVGRQCLQSGSLLVFNQTPGSTKSGIPGSCIGYMPQELALYPEFTINETLYYFGGIFGMSNKNILHRTEFLLNFLNLSNEKTILISKLSGGQQRRTSLAAALLHQPKLLILDEPTVGVDPMLRQSIWLYLLEITNNLATTIVITTHYIEEAREANMVGMLRNGRLLTQSKPTELLDKYNMNNLEDVFLHLCKVDDGNDNNIETCLDKFDQKNLPQNTSIISSRKNSILSCIQSGKKMFKQNFCCCNDLVSIHRLGAIIIKNFIRMWRNIGFIIFQFIVPALQVSLFCLAIGRESKGMSLAVVNDDAVKGCHNFQTGCVMGHKDTIFGHYDLSKNHRHNLSCRYLNYINVDFLKLVYFQNYSIALESVVNGENWGLLYFMPNYSAALFERMFGMITFEIPNSSLNVSDLHVSLDMTNQQVGYTIQHQLVTSFQKFFGSLLTACNITKELAALPIKFHKPIYGSKDISFTEFMAPSVIVSIIFFMAVGLTAVSFITERKEGLFDRSWIAGVTSTEFMLAHVVTQFVIMIIQVALVLIFMIYIFHVPTKGSLIWIVTLTLLQGICGMALGLLISSICNSEQDAIQLALSSFYPNMLLSGIIWPLEAIPKQLLYISYLLPQTYACESMRGIFSRGWGIEWMPIYRGYIVTLVWTFGMLAVSAIIMSKRK